MRGKSTRLPRNAQRYGLGVDGLTIRAARPGDVDALADLARRTWSDAFGGGVSRADEEAELDEGRSARHFADALTDKVVLVAEAAGALVGYVQLGDVGIAGVEARPGDRGLQRLYVETALQGQGIGHALLEAALAHPLLAGATRVLLQVW